MTLCVFVNISKQLLSLEVLTTLPVFYHDKTLWGSCRLALSQLDYFNELAPITETVESRAQLLIMSC